MRSPPKNSKWELFGKLQFLESITTEKPDSSNSKTVTSVTLTANEQSESQPKISEECLNEGSQSPKPPPLPPSSKRKERKKSQDTFPEYLKKVSHSQQISRAELSINTSTHAVEDDITSFGNHVKTVLRKLNSRLQVEAKNEIFNILTKYEVAQIDIEEGEAILGISSSSASLYSPRSTVSTPEPPKLFQT